MWARSNEILIIGQILLLLLKERKAVTLKKILNSVFEFFFCCYLFTEPEILSNAHIQWEYSKQCQDSSLCLYQNDCSVAHRLHKSEVTSHLYLLYFWLHLPCFSTSLKCWLGNVCLIPIWDKLFFLYLLSCKNVEISIYLSNIWTSIWQYGSCTWNVAEIQSICVVLFFQNLKLREYKVRGYVETISKLLSLPSASKLWQKHLVCSVHKQASFSVALWVWIYIQNIHYDFWLTFSGSWDAPITQE